MASCGPLCDYCNASPCVGASCPSNWIDDGPYPPPYDDEERHYESESACESCGGSGWVRLSDAMLAECAECGGDG